MKRYTITCDRCGFTEEIEGVNQKKIRSVVCELAPIMGRSNTIYQDAQDMCDECVESVKHLLEGVFKKMPLLPPNTGPRE